jgi:hypothetical protein
MNVEQSYHSRTNHSAVICNAFYSKLDSLYLLALLLMADSDAAEACLLSALDECLDARLIPASAGNSLDRLSVMKQAATRLAQSRWLDVSPSGARVALENSVLLAIARLPARERFAFVVTILERRSVKECAALAQCSARDVTLARVEAMQQLAANLFLSPTDHPSTLASSAMAAA